MLNAGSDILHDRIHDQNQMNHKARKDLEDFRRKGGWFMCPRQKWRKLNGCAMCQDWGRCDEKSTVPYDE